MVDAVALAQALIRCPSVTPMDAGALDVLQGVLEGLGFTCRRLPFDDDGAERVDNLYARLGREAPHFCYAGHTDVVPVGAREQWSVDPFEGAIRDGVLYGRGAADMKGAIACFVAALSAYLKDHDGQVPGSVSLLITGDEEGVAINGTRKVLDWLKSQGEVIDACLVGEPTNPDALGDMIKIGRRGSLNARITVHGTGGHVAYPHLADNPVPRMVEILRLLTSRVLDEGTEHFQPSNLEITSVDVGNDATNVIPAKVTARLNIRFNDRHTGEDLVRWIRETCESVGGRFDLETHISGEPFLTPPGLLSGLVAGAVERVTGRSPALSTSGGTSDARFIKDACPVVEFGLVGKTMHKVDERVALADLETLTRIYREILDGFFVSRDVT
ncbi:MAG: succinyl-diaminopimelate desuccinylase [Alphaproteobacteria bacterium]|nr:MAG: succinyl-diaminopimelate desuccinylase [Alphaproteobacteria bacterium]